MAKPSRKGNINSELRAALQNVSLTGLKMTNGFEWLITSLNALTDVRGAINKRPDFGEALVILCHL